MSEDEWIDQWANDGDRVEAWRRLYRSVVEDMLSTATRRMEAEAAKLRRDWPEEAERLTMAAQLVAAAVRHGQEYSRDSAMARSRRRMTETRLVEAVRHFNDALDRLRRAREPPPTAGPQGKSARTKANPAAKRQKRSREA